MSQIYTAGTLLWVDDDFALDHLNALGGSEVATWRRTFGDADSRVYRLLDLQLEIATSREGAFAAIEQLQQLDHRHRFVQAVVDLRIPAASGRRAEMKQGLAVARRLKELQIPFVFLSSSSSAMKELAEWGLDRVPYFTKVPAPSPTIMPNHLVRHLLGEFRNRVSWLDLYPILARFDVESRHPLKQMRICDRYFPFFGSYRDFVERVEARSGQHRTMRTVLRAPRTHGKEFITQCISVVVGGASLVAKPRLIYLDSTQQDLFGEIQRTVDQDDGRLSLVIRFFGDSPDAEREILEKALRFKRTALYFVLPQDEAADPFLRTLSSEPNVTYDDLPETRLHDRAAREDLIRRAASFVFQEFRLSIGDGGLHPLASIFLKYPEIAIHPVNWAFLLEAEEIASELSDPQEILLAVDLATQELKQWPPECARTLVEGRPNPNRALLRPAESSYQQRGEGHPNWIRRAFREWLKESWRTPYGAISDRHDRLNEQLLLQWEGHCLDLARQMAELFLKESYFQLVEGNQDPELESLAAAARFLMHPAITKMMEQCAGPDDWVGFEAVRWPHAAFPLPAALNRKLKTEGRYLWVQTDLLDRVTVIRGGQRAVDRLEIRAQLHHRRLDWLKHASCALPRGWKEPAQYLLKLIESRQIEAAWTDMDRRSEMWGNLYSLVLNGTPISHLFWSMVKKDDTFNDDEIAVLGSAQGAGKLLNIIRARRERMAAIFEPTELRSRSWLQAVDDVRIGMKFFREFQQRTPDWPAKIDGKEIFSYLAEAVQTLELGDVQDLNGNAIEQVGNNISHRLFEALYDPKSGLQSGNLFEKFKSGETPDLPHWSPLLFGASRGLVIDYLMSGCDTAEQLRAVLRPFLYVDGYHFIALLWDLRNEAKQVAPDVDVRIIQTVMEHFIFGFEGLVCQLKWCLAACGRADLASSIPNATMQLKRLPESAIPGLDQAMRVTGEGANDYSVFTLGMPGALARRLAYAAGEKRMVTFEEMLTVAAE